MTPHSKCNVLGVQIAAIDSAGAVNTILSAARNQRCLTVSALAVHGVMTGVLDPEHRYRLNHLDLVVADGQPVRWALRLLHGVRLADRVYGPDLMLRLCEGASAEGLSVYLYGSRRSVLRRLVATLRRRFPALHIAGARPSCFRQLAEDEQHRLAAAIRASGAAMTFVGLGCPRQEVWAYEHRTLLGMPIVAVGAAFDFHAGLLRQAPPSLQRHGLEWVWRLGQEPRRLWRRYLYLNPAYLGLLAAQAAGLRRFDQPGHPPARMRRDG